ncbi:MAG: hypothetical protein JRN06_13190 [Nitrososphaerota archaeon]|nr:hypothetical protein [Nitrososphaerota archaeon]
MPISDMPQAAKTLLLKLLGLDANNEGYVTREGKVVIDEYIEQPVRVENMALFSGSTIVLDDNPLSIASYIEEHGEV